MFVAIEFYVQIMHDINEIFLSLSVFSLLPLSLLSLLPIYYPTRVYIRQEIHKILHFTIKMREIKRKFFFTNGLPRNKHKYQIEIPAIKLKIRLEYTTFPFTSIYPSQKDYISHYNSTIHSISIKYQKKKKIFFIFHAEFL